MTEWGELWKFTKVMTEPLESVREKKIAPGRENLQKKIQNNKQTNKHSAPALRPSLKQAPHSKGPDEPARVLTSTL